MKELGGFLAAKNQKNLARYAWRVHKQGGSVTGLWRAHDLKDVRNDEDLLRSRRIAFLVWRARKVHRKLMKKAKASRAKVILDKARKQRT